MGASQGSEKSGEKRADGQWDKEQPSDRFDERTRICGQMAPEEPRLSSEARRIGRPYQRLRRKNSHKTATIMTIHKRGWTTRPSTAAMTTIITAMRMSSNTVVSVPDHRTGQTSRRRRCRSLCCPMPRYERRATDNG